MSGTVLISGAGMKFGEGAGQATGRRLRRRAVAARSEDRGILRRVRRPLSAGGENKASSSWLVRLEGGHAHV